MLFPKQKEQKMKTEIEKLENVIRIKTKSKTILIVPQGNELKVVVEETGKTVYTTHAPFGQPSNDWGFPAKQVRRIVDQQDGD